MRCFVTVLIMSVGYCFPLIAASVDFNKAKLEKYERMSQEVKREMVGVQEEFLARASSYNEFLEQQAWDSYSSTASSMLNSKVEEIVDKHRTVVRLKAFLEKLREGKDEEEGKIDHWYTFSKDKKKNEIEWNFRDLREKTNEMLNSIRDELKPQVRSRLYNVLETAIEKSYNAWEKGDGKVISSLLSERFKLFLKGEFKEIRGRSQSDARYISVATIVRELQTIPAVARIFSTGTDSSVLRQIDAALRRKYPAPVLDNYGSAMEVFSMLTSTGRHFIHIPGVGKDFYDEYFRLLSIEPTCRSMLDLQRCTSKVAARELLFGSSGKKKGWLLETLQTQQKDGKRYLNNVLLITEAHAFFGKLEQIPQEVGKTGIDFLKLIMDSGAMFQEMPYFFDSKVNISELKVIMIGEGAFLVDFEDKHPAYVSEEEVEAVVSRLVEPANHVIPIITETLSNSELGLEINRALARHPKVGQLHQIDKNRIAAATKSVLKGGIPPKALSMERKPYARELKRKDIIPFIDKLLNYYVEEALK